MFLEKIHATLHKNHREIRQGTVESFYAWLQSNSPRGTFALIIFTRKKYGIFCKKEILQLNSTHLI